MNEEKKKTILPKDFFSIVRNLITSKEALKDVVPVNWEEVLKDRKENDEQIIKLVKKDCNEIR